MSTDDEFVATRIAITVDAGVADVRLNRPEKRNSIDTDMFDALVLAGERLKTEPGLRAVVLSGEGPDFCAGLDFGSFRAMQSGDGAKTTRPLPRATGASKIVGPRAAYVWAELPVPVIAAVQGHALGGGLQVALGADIRIVAPDAKLALLEVAWGLVPDMTATQLLPEFVGRDVAKELIYTARTVSGEEAVRIGLATRLADDPRTAALDLARQIAAQSPHAIRAAKRLLDAAGRVSLTEGLAAEQYEVGLLARSPNQVEAVTARFEKRTPDFADVEE